MLRIVLLSLLVSACTAVALVYSQRRPSLAPTFPSDRLQTPAMDLADEGNRKALRRLQAPSAFYRGQWLGDACIDGGADAPEIYVLSRFGMSSHGPVDRIRVTVRIDSGGEVIHESQDSMNRDGVTGFRKRGFDQQEAGNFRQLLVDGGYLSAESHTDGRNCFFDSVVLQSCVQGRYFGRVSHCEEVGAPSLSQLADDIEAFALGEQTAVDGD